MADKTTSEVPDHERFRSLIDRLTELNSRHLKSESRRGGLEVEIAHCEEAIARGERPEDLQVDLDALRQELAMVEQSRREIDQERARLSEALRAFQGPSRNHA